MERARLSEWLAKYDQAWRSPGTNALADLSVRTLWIVRLDDSGRCFDFEEWPFWPPDQKGAPATGAV
jgi:hypothetical protein